MSASGIYEGWVRHRRRSPVAHSFRMRLYMGYFDLAELPDALDGSPLWSARRPAAVWLRRSDLLGDPRQPLRDAVLDLVEERTGARTSGAVRVLTHPRTLGLCLNPISLYYCFARDERLEAVVAEVTNTPWGEKHSYVVSRGEARGQVLSERSDKELHVSPFHGMEQSYEWRVSEPGERLQVHIENEQEGRTLFDATLSLERREPNARNLRRMLARYPAVTARVGGGIYLHALRLWLKGAPYHPHPAS